VNHAVKRKKILTLERKTARAGYIFVLPFIIGFFGIYIFTLFDSVWLSFHNLILGASRFSLEYAGLAHYRFALMEAPDFLRNVIEAIAAMLLELPIIILFSLLVAVMLNQNFPGRTMFRVIFFIPVILSAGIVIRADLTNYILNSIIENSGAEYGIPVTGLDFFISASRFLGQMSFSPALVGYVHDAVSGIFDVVNRSGVQILLFFSGLQAISPSIYEAAQIEGASPWESFWKITFPMMSPVIVVNTIYSIINSFTRSDNPIMLSILSLVGNYGLRNAMAWIYCFIILLVLSAAYLIISRMVFYQDKRK